jgi:hypothetical protein
MFHFGTATSTARVAAFGLIAATAAGFSSCVSAAGDRAGASDDRDNPARCCPIVELRQYTLHPDKLDGFIQMFEREFIETQEAVGIKVIGHFRDRDDPNRFVWFRGFTDMPARAEALQAFYGGPVWKEHRDAANANFVDIDNVLLLHPFAPSAGFAIAGTKRPPLRGDVPAKGMVVATIYSLHIPAAEFAEYFGHTLEPALAHAGISVVAALETESSPNTFPRLPVREGENVFIWVAAFASPESYRKNLDKLERSRSWRETIAPGLQQRMNLPPQILQLTPAPRSLLHG